jgi:hypothetical protein
MYYTTIAVVNDPYIALGQSKMWWIGICWPNVITLRILWFHNHQAHLGQLAVYGLWMWTIQGSMTHLRFFYTDDQGIVTISTANFVDLPVGKLYNHGEKLRIRIAKSKAPRKRAEHFDSTILIRL